MSDFGVEAELSVVVPRRELRSARQEVEDALADIPVGMSAGGGGAGGSATNAAREQRRRRREFRWARQRTDDTEAQLEVLENIEGELTEGGFGGGGDIISSVTDIGGEAAGIASDVGTTLVEALPSALGSLAGTALGQRLGGDGGGGGGGTLTVPKPEWVPIDVRDPSPLGVSDPSPLSVDDPSPLGVEDPSPLSVDDPSPLTVTDPSPLKVMDPPALEVETPMLQVEKPEWVPIQVERVRGDGTQPSPQPQRRVNRGGQTRGAIQEFGAALDNLGVNVAERILPGEAPDFASQPLGEGGTFFGRPGETIGRAFDTTNPLTRGGFGSGGTGGGGTSINATTGDVNVTVNADVQSAVQSAIDELRREQDRQRQELRRELQNEIDGLRREISGGSQGRGFRR